jgi:hypothetical protein
VRGVQGFAGTVATWTSAGRISVHRLRGSVLCWSIRGRGRAAAPNIDRHKAVEVITQKEISNVATVQPQHVVCLEAFAGNRIADARL